MQDRGPIQTVTAQIVSKQPPAPNQKTWKLTTADNTVYRAKDAHAKDLVPGGNFVIKYRDSKFNDATIHFTEEVTAVAGQAGNGPVQANTYPGVAPSLGPRDNTIGIFGMLNQFIATGKVALNDEAIAEAWVHIYAGLRKGQRRCQSPQVNDAIEDEIPY
jgi:hypothetical protein